MFTVQIEGTKYQFRFRHNKIRTRTTCIITAKNVETNEPIPGDYKIRMGKITFSALAFGWAKVSPPDTFNKYVGLKTSLKKALDNMDFDKVRRAIVWDKYFEMVNNKLR